MDTRAGLIDGRVDPPRFGTVRAGDRLSLPYVMVDAAGLEVEPVSRFLQHLRLGDRSPLTVRSYAMDLLRWWRILGAAGIGLARVCSLTHVDDATIRKEVEIALNTTTREGFGSSHCQCHGDLGNLELLLHAGSALQQPKWRSQAGRLAHGVLDSIDERSWICGVALGTETPGLLVGLAGIGYGLLRMAAPDQVPAVLTLDPGHE